MKVNDTLIKFNPNRIYDNSRERAGLVYAKCHELNIVAKKRGEKDKYFVFSNPTNSHYILKRSENNSDNLDGVSVSYDTDKYRDYILFQGLKEDDNQKIKLSNDFIRFIFNLKTFSYIKKVIAISNGGKRPISICRTEFRNVSHEKITKDDYLTGYGGRLSYGCGLLIPVQVYSHLMNFVQK